MNVYLIGALKNETIPALAVQLRADGHTVMDDWYSPGPETDRHWREHEQQRGRSFREALKGEHAQTCFQMDKRLLDASDVAVLVCPAGKSAHLELGYMVGKDKRTAILLDSPDRWDVMYAFADTVVETVEELRKWLQPAVKAPRPCLQCGKNTADQSVIVCWRWRHFSPFCSSRCSDLFASWIR